MSEELNNHRPYTAAELSEMLHNERASWAEEVNALGHAIGFDRVQQAGSILEAVRQLASRPAPAVQVPEGMALVPVRATDEMLDDIEEALKDMGVDPELAGEIDKMALWMDALAAAPATVETEAVAQVWTQEQVDAINAEARALHGTGRQKPQAEPVAQGGGVELACTNQALLGWGDARRVAKALIEDGYVMRHELEEAVRCIATVNKEEQP